MSQFNLKQYYVEQDERMNLLEETVDEYMKRTVSFRRSQSSNAYAFSSRIQHDSFLKAENARNATPDAAPAPAGTPLASDKVISIPEDHGTSNKRKASESLEPAVQKRFIVEQGSARAIKSDLSGMPLSSPYLQRTASIGGKSDEEPKKPEASSPSLEDIDSFTVDLSDIKISPSKVKAGKRKPNTRDTQQTPQKKQRVNLARSPQMPEDPSATEQSPISSFSVTTVHPPNKVRPAPRKDEGPQVPRPVLPLHLVPQVLHKQIKPVKIVPETPTSPMEDPSVLVDDPPLQSPTKKKPLESEPSKTLLNLQERIAKHAGKHRDKVLKVGSKSAIGEPSTSKSTALPAGKSTITYVSSSPSSRATSPELASKQSIAKSTQAKPMKGKTPAVAKKPSRKPKRVPMTYPDFVQKLQANVASNEIKIKKRRRFEGTNIMYVGGDLTFATPPSEEKMKLIVKHGGNLMPEFDPNVTTHIIARKDDRSSVLQATRLSKMRDIPKHVSIVTWDWVAAVIDADTNTLSRTLSQTWKYPSFSYRVDKIPLPTITPMTSLKTFKEFKSRTKAKSTDNIPTTAASLPTLPPITSSTSLPVIGQVATASTSAANIQLPSTNHQPGALLSPPASPIRPTGASSSSATHKHCGDKGDVEDPLAEFYDQAREQKQFEDGWSSCGDIGAMGGPDRDETDDSEPEQVQPLPRKKRDWTCDAKEPQPNSQCPNQDIIDKLAELRKIHKAKVGDEHHWRVFALGKAIRALRNHPQRVKGFEDANRIPGIGEKTARKIAEILETGGLRRIAYENSQDVQVTRLFQGIYGVGQTIALQWYSAGCRTLEDLREGKFGVKLSAVQKIGLQFYDDINDRMPRAEAKQIYDLIKPIALSVDSDLFIEIMGSYRRGKADCGDIDILITRSTDDGSTHRGVLSRLLRDLHKTGIITDDLALPDDPDDLEATYRGLCRLPGVKGAKRRRIDFLTVPWTSKGAALLYYTGDDIFNRAIRLKANVMGYSLNQKGLFANVVRDPRDRRIKMNNGQLVASKTEEEIFKILGVPWQEPHERVRG